MATEHQMGDRPPSFGWDTTGIQLGRIAAALEAIEELMPRHYPPSDVPAEKPPETEDEDEVVAEIHKSMVDTARHQPKPAPASPGPREAAEGTASVLDMVMERLGKDKFPERSPSYWAMLSDVFDNLRAALDAEAKREAQSEPWAWAVTPSEDDGGSLTDSEGDSVDHVIFFDQQEAREFAGEERQVLPLFPQLKAEAKRETAPDHSALVRAGVDRLRQAAQDVIDATPFQRVTDAFWPARTKLINSIQLLAKAMCDANL